MPKDKNMDRDAAGRNENDLPGYPHYPAGEDITNPDNGFKKISADEELANSGRMSSRMVNEKNEGRDSVDQDEEDNLGIVSGTEADVTAEDLTLLGDKDADQDLGEDEDLLKSRVDRIDDEEELDVPGAEMDDEDEALGEEDEENNYYSLGGDRHENLEEDSAADND